MTFIENSYQKLFSHDENFKKIYLTSRINLYSKIIKIIKKLNVVSLLDIGCAYGKLVEIANQEKINAFGLDLPIEELKNHHKQLTLSRGKFFYGSVNDDDLVDKLKKEKIECLVLLDTFRYIEKIENLNELGADLIIIKELSNNYRMCQDREKYLRDHFDIKLYFPSEIIKIFKNYKPLYIFPSKFIFKIKNPANFVCKLINFFFPTYTLILKNDSSKK